MQLIKLGLISTVFLFLLMTAISLLLPSTVRVSRTIDINAPFDSVFNQINDLRKWKNWYANYDSVHVSFATNSVGKNGWMKMNNTTVSILATDRHLIKTLWQSGSKSLESDFDLYQQGKSSTVTVHWYFVQQVKWYPWEKFASIVLDKTIGPVQERSLDKLKNLLEN